MQESFLSMQVAGTKKCTRCKEWLPLDHFIQRVRNNRTFYESWCRACHTAHTLAKYHADPDKREKRLKANLKFMYGISVEEYETLLETQGGVCAICKQADKTLDPRTKEPKRLVVDHDHKTGKVRGLLCGHCNSSIGFLEKKFDHLGSMLDYLQAHKEKER